MGSCWSNSVWKDYEELKKLGEGAFGVVWKVKKKNTEKVFALKEFKKLVHVKQSDAKKEIAVLKNVGFHRNIVQLIDAIVDSDSTYILFEFCDLGTLDEYVKTTDAPLEPLMGDMINGLIFLHAQGLVHRDLKPANILLSGGNPRPVCKIADFGLSKFVDPSFLQSIGGDLPGYYLNTYCGTRYYMAPELSMRHYNKACDVFSLGAIFFVLVSKQRLGIGKEAFLAPSIGGNMLRQVKDNDIEVAVKKLRVEFEGFREMIIMMLKQDYKQRADIDTVYQMYNNSKGVRDSGNVYLLNR